jgi:hypothetical protein
MRVGNSRSVEVPDKYPHLLRDRECASPLQLRALAHHYETDIVAISFDTLAAPLASATTGGPLSTLCLKKFPIGSRSAGTTSTARFIRHQAGGLR